MVVTEGVEPTIHRAFKTPAYAIPPRDHGAGSGIRTRVSRLATWCLRPLGHTRMELATGVEPVISSVPRTRVPTPTQLASSFTCVERDSNPHPGSTPGNRFCAGRVCRFRHRSCGYWKGVDGRIRTCEYLGCSQAP